MSVSTRVPPGVSTGGQFAAPARDEAVVGLAAAGRRAHDGLVDAEERAARCRAIEVECLVADGQGIGHRFEVEDLAGVITDLGAPIDQVDAWRAEGLEVVTADPGPHEAVPARPRDLRRVTRPGRANSR